MHPPELLNPTHFWSRDEVLAHPCPIPRQAGVYAWYFRSILPRVPTGGCARQGDCTLLYLGIAPKAPPLRPSHYWLAPSSGIVLGCRRIL